MTSDPAVSRKASRFQLKFTNSSPALLPPDEGMAQLSGQALLKSRSAAALRLHHARLAGHSERLALCFLLSLALLLAWLIGYFHASPALLVLLGVASLALGRGRWQGVVEGAGLEAELKVRKQLRMQLRGESVEWLNFLINRWWSTCNQTVLDFAKEYVQPLLADLLPPGIDSLEIVEVDFGEQTPVISNMRVLDVPTATSSTTETGPASSACTVVVSFDLTLPCPDSNIILRARVGGKSVGSNHLVYVESLYLSGTIQAVVNLDSHAPFPNILKITASFSNKPDVWFSVRVLKGLKVTSLPLLKSLVHSMVLDMINTLLVDPGRLTLNFDPSSASHGSVEEVGHAVGVITISVAATAKSKEGVFKGGTGGRWMSLRLGKKKYQQQLALQGGTCHATYSFLASDLKHDVVVLKLKVRGVVQSSTLAVHSVGLHSLGLVSETGEESAGDRVVSFSNSEFAFSLTLCYSPLPSFSLHISNGFPPIQRGNVSGVLCVHVHRAQDLRGCDSDGLSDPYCIVQANKEKILRTRHISNSLAPCWETGTEVLVADITQVTLTFTVLDWDGPLVGDDLLGVAKFTLPEGCSEVIQHKLELQGGKGVKVKESRRGSKLGTSGEKELALGMLTVSVIFRPVASVGTSSPKCHVTSIGGAGHLSWEAGPDNHPEDYRGKLKRLKSQYQEQGPSVLELEVMRGHDLVPKDSNGLSDPYVVVKYGSKIMFKSKVIKKSLNPEWNARVTLTPPSPDDIIYVECWDKDVFSDDFMGSVQFTDKDLEIFKEREQWCKLEHVKHGQLLLRLRVEKEGSREGLSWAHLDEASRQLVGEVTMCEGPSSMNSAIIMRPPSEVSLSSSSSGPGSGSMQEDSSDAGIVHPHSAPSFQSSDSANKSPTSSGQLSAHIPAVSPSSISNSSTEGKPYKQHPPLRRRHTLSHHASSPSRHTQSPEHVPLIPRYPETRADIQWALNRASEEGGASKTHTTERFKEKQITVYHSVSGQVVEASGLKGELDHMELYVKVRLNTRPSYQRQHKFGRGPVVHKTRVLKGSYNPQWREDFMVKESPVPSDSLLTLDLKSGSKVNLGTYAVTLDKFFDGNLKATRYYDIGNNVKLRVKLSRQMR